MEKVMKREKEKKKGVTAVIGILLLLLAAAAVVSVLIGRYSITPEVLFEILFRGGSAVSEDAEAASLVLFEARLARICAAVLIGASLSAAGAAYQGIFRNPMVSPDILGAATGASFGAALAILLGGNALAVQISAFCFGLAAVAAAYMASSILSGESGGATLTLVLTGMVIAALFSAFISIIKFVGDPYDTLPTITFWLMGGLTYVTRSDLYIMLIPFAAGMIPLMLLRWRLNILSFDDEEAAALGVDTKKTRAVIILCATLMSSSSVAVGGMIGWVGLIVPHIARMIAGPDYSRMLPCSVLIGGLFLLVVDDLARCLFAQELPLGVLTAIIGAPFFLYLMFKGKKSFL